MKSEPYRVGISRGAAAVAWLPSLVFLGGNAVLFVLSLACPSFAMLRRIYNFNTILAPGLFAIAAAAGFARWRRRRSDRVVLRLSLAFAVVAALAWGFRLYATHIEPNLLILREVVIETDKAFRPLRILHVTDIQSAAVGAHDRKAFARMRELNPDLILFTGDLLQPPAPATIETELPKIAALFRTLAPPLDIYGVDGDVDGRLRNASEDDLGGLHILRNNEVVLEANGARLRIFGIPCEASRARTSPAEAIRSWFGETAPSDFTILLGHAPDYVLAIKDVPIDLCLAGHTHGGQVRIPFVGPIVTLSRVPRLLARGFHKVGRTRLNVSAGIGCEHLDRVPPIRFACPPEMTLITLVPKRAMRLRDEPSPAGIGM